MGDEYTQYETVKQLQVQVVPKCQYKCRSYLQTFLHDRTAVVSDFFVQFLLRHGVFKMHLQFTSIRFVPLPRAALRPLKTGGHDFGGFFKQFQTPHRFSRGVLFRQGPHVSRNVHLYGFYFGGRLPFVQRHLFGFQQTAREEVFEFHVDAGKKRLGPHPSHVLIKQDLHRPQSKQTLNNGRTMAEQ